jgi:hypothetical protein
MPRPAFPDLSSRPGDLASIEENVSSVNLAKKSTKAKKIVDSAKPTEGVVYKV